ncbi:hypothetical protein BHE74_00056740 [Ensete ventricosum]|nr:hypothetical protein BHE74_00056740 [Ensete ventricosum]
MTTSWVEEDSEVYLSGGGSYGPLPRRWKELRTKVRLSDQSVGFKRKPRFCASTAEAAAEEASMAKAEATI